MLDSDCFAPMNTAPANGFMHSKRVAPVTTCPVELAIKIIGGKWKPMILWNLHEEKKRFGELKRLITGITVKMLAQQLRELEEDGIISRKMYHEVPPRVEYSLTDIGHSLDPVLAAMCAWGKNYSETVLKRPT